MPTTIQITAGKLKLQAQLNDCPTARSILKALAARPSYCPKLSIPSDSDIDRITAI